MVVFCSILIMMDKTLARILYSNDFYIAWRYVPFLLIAIVFGAISGHIGGIFSAVKDSKIYAQSTIIGAVINLTLNIVLVPIIGPLGAAFATSLSYCTVWFFRLRHVKRYINLRLNLKRDYIAYGILFLQSFFLLFYTDNEIILLIIEFVFVILIVFLYFYEFKLIVSFIKNINK
jgi:O-antigen/teichoic acid export membrane protein